MPSYCKTTDYSQSSNWLIISRRAVGPGTGDIATAPVCPSVAFSFRTVTRKRIDVFSRKLFRYVHHVMVLKKIKFQEFVFSIFHVFLALYAISNIKKKKVLKKIPAVVQFFF